MTCDSFYDYFTLKNCNFYKKKILFDSLYQISSGQFAIFCVVKINWTIIDVFSYTSFVFKFFFTLFVSITAILEFLFLYLVRIFFYFFVCFLILF